jgi:precorrin-2 dehydrogenase / sirohydrochlorin ferrochelatase
MPLYPLFADLRQRAVLVVGGGEVATRKVEALLQAGALVTVCAPQLSPALAALCAAGRLQHRADPFDPDWLDTVWLLVAATDDAGFNAMLAAEAGKRRLLANIVDDAVLSSFQVPAVIDRAPLLLALSSSGVAPMLARRLRRQLETVIDAAWGALAQLLARHRDAIRRRLPDLAERRQWYDAQLDGPLLALLRSGDHATAEQTLLAGLASKDDAPPRGSLCLVSVPSNAAAQLSLIALQVMSQADLVVCHAAMQAEVLAQARRDASRERLAAIAADTAARLALQVAGGRRVLLLWPDATPLAPLQAAIAAVARGAVIELIACAGDYRRVG